MNHLELPQNLKKRIIMYLYLPPSLPPSAPRAVWTVVVTHGRSLL